MTNYKGSGDWGIRINGGEHGLPHVHVVFKDGSRVSVAIQTRKILAGGVTPVGRLTAALADIAKNEQLYLDEYRRLNP